MTFHDNYANCSQALGVNLLVNPDLLASDDLLAARSAGWFWLSINGNGYVERDDFDGLSTRVNGTGISQDSLIARRKLLIPCRRAVGLA